MTLGKKLFRMMIDLLLYHQRPHPPMIGKRTQSTEIHLRFAVKYRYKKGILWKDCRK